MAHDVGAVREGHEPGAVVEEIAEPRRIEHPRRRVDRPLPNGDAALGEPPPDAGVRLVVLVGDDDGVTLGPSVTERVGEDEGVLRRRRPDDHLVVGDVHQRRQAHVRVVHHLARLYRRRVWAVWLNLGPGVEVGQPFDRLPAGV